MKHAGTKEKKIKEKKMKKLSKMLVVLTLVCSMFLTACGAPKTIEEYYNQPVIRQALDAQLEQLAEQNSTIFSKVEMAVTENDVVYNYYYVGDVEVDPDLLTMTDAQFDQAKQAIEGDCKILPNTITYNYYYNDGTLIKSLSK